MTVSILDTTLRDGEQTSGVSFAPQEKLSIARFLLDDLGVNRIEVASARVSKGEMEAVSEIARWALRRNLSDRVEVLGFIDDGLSVDWISQAGVKVVNFLAKGSERHLQGQLGKTLEEHVADIRHNVDLAVKAGLSVNLYLEDWSNGIKTGPDYVFALMDALKDLPVGHYMLPDTLGILSPGETYEFCRLMLQRYPGLCFDFHAHNDYDLAVANTLSAVQAGITCVHTTVNGLGERAGNAPMTSVLAVLHDQLNVQTSLKENRFYTISKLVETCSGIRIPNNKPIIGDNVFTQVAGVHADGDCKASLYCNDLVPERFGRVREYALGKNSGKASIRQNLESLGIDIDETSMDKVTARIIELGDKKQLVTAEELPYIVSDVLKHNPEKQNIKVLNYSLSLTHGLRPVATVQIEINGSVYQQEASGDGQYNAFTKALWKIYHQLEKPIPELIDYMVTIPPGGKTDALVHTTITWRLNGKIFKTHGLDPDQTEAAIKATVKMLNVIEDESQYHLSTKNNPTL